VGDANRRFTHTFTQREERKFDPETKKWLIELIDPAGRVAPDPASGYQAADVPFGF
jgi:hypothetical protein